jgi:hypothetical protein
MMTTNWSLKPNGLNLTLQKIPKNEKNYKMDQENKKVYKLFNPRSMTSHNNQITLGDKIQSTTLIQTQFLI